jgi:predicted transcriptional regulator
MPTNPQDKHPLHNSKHWNCGLPLITLGGEADMERVNEDVRDISGLLADETTQQILIETTDGPMSADELSDVCGVSPQTVYRRLEQLQEYDMVTEAVEPDDDGHHHKVYTATLDRVTITLTSEGFKFELSLRERMAARFTQFVSEVRDR